MVRLQKELDSLKKFLAGTSMKKPFEFFKIDAATVQKYVNEKQAAINEINKSLAGDAEDVEALFQEHVYNGWNVGDFRHLLDMIRETHQMFKMIKDQAVRDQMLEVISPVIDLLHDGDIREARDTMVPFTEQMRRYQNLFQQGPQRGGPSKNMLNALDKLEQLINSKMPKDDYSGDTGGDNFNGGTLPPKPSSMPFPMPSTDRQMQDGNSPG